MIGWSMMPSIGLPRCSSPISVPNTGMPVMKALVPSIGSSTQTYSASSRSRAVFLAEDAVLRARPLLEQRAHRRFGLAVGDGHRAVVGLGVDAHRRAEIAPDHAARRLGHFIGERDQSGIEGHAKTP